MQATVADAKSASERLLRDASRYGPEDQGGQGQWPGCPKMTDIMDAFAKQHQDVD